MGGGGRAGTVYAAYLIHQGVPVEEVLQRVPGVEKDVQKAFLHGFAAGLEREISRE
jgi:protein-tyrosine phosphatase